MEENKSQEPNKGFFKKFTAFTNVDSTEFDKFVCELKGYLSNDTDDKLSVTIKPLTTDKESVVVVAGGLLFDKTI